MRSDRYKVEFESESSSWLTDDLILDVWELGFLDLERYIHLKNNETIGPSFKAVSIPGALTGGGVRRKLPHGKSFSGPHSQPGIMHIYAQANYVGRRERLNKPTIKDGSLRVPG